MKNRKIALLVNVLIVFLSSMCAKAADFRSLAELQKAAPASRPNSVLVAKEKWGTCMAMGHSAIRSQLAKGFCEGINLNKRFTKFNKHSGLNGLPVRASQSSAQRPSAARQLINRTKRARNMVITIGANCLSRGGSNAGATGDAGSFCLAADIKAVKATPANFSVSNGIPVEGLQYLQVTFQDGSKLVGSRRLPGGGAAAGAKCISIGGSNAGSTGENGDFCLASDLITSTTAPANFSVANSLPVVSLQLLQVTFRDNNPFDQLGNLPGFGAKCVSANGTVAANGDSGGFCLVSNLSASIRNQANFAVANGLSAAGLQFLQISFLNGYSSIGKPPVAGVPLSAECISSDGSIATAGNGETCLVSQLSTLADGFENISMANDLPVKGLQFLQVMFRDGAPTKSSNNAQQCVSVGGSNSTFGNAGGFCLASDRRISKTNYANFSLANNLPVTSLKFIQIPNREGGHAFEPRRPEDIGSATGVAIYEAPNNSPSLPILSLFAGHRQHYFSIHEQLSEIALNPQPALDPIFLFLRDK